MTETLEPSGGGGVNFIQIGIIFTLLLQILDVVGTFFMHVRLKSNCCCVGNFEMEPADVTSCKVLPNEIN